jgi:hypothetical protein
MADVGREEKHSRKIFNKITKKDSPKIRTKQQESKHVHVELPEDEKHFDFRSEYISHSKKTRWGMIGVWVLIISVCVSVFVLASFLLHNAVVDIKIKEITTDVDTDVKMVRKDESGALSFEIVSLNKEVGQSVPTNGEKQVSIKASGKVIIYNKNITSQKLLSQTRLESSNGKIYRIPTTITVAGAKKGLPGSLEVNAVADVAGSDYNSELVDLTFPGFKGSAKYQTVYARSKTAFTGGESGMVKIADIDDLNKAKISVIDSLSNQLLSSANQQIPGSFILLPNIYKIQYASSTQETKDNTLTLRQKADFVGVLVDIDKISQFLAKKAIPGYSGEDIIVDNIKDLVFEYTSGTSSLNLNTQSLFVKIKGKPHFVYGYDADNLKADLVGLSRESFATVIATYPGLEKGNSKINPFWRSRFPTDLSKITINEEK